MTQFRKNKLRTFFLINLMASLLSGCADNNTDSQGARYDPNKPVSLDIFYPIEGGIATKLILNGSNFGTDLKNIKVYFNDKRAAVVNSTGNKLYVVTPKQPGNLCDISVVVGNDSVVYDQKFTYHTMTTVTTVCGKPGTVNTQVGTLAETEFPVVTYLAIDDDDNLFVGSRGSSYYDNNTYVMLNENKNMSTILISNTGVPVNQPCMLDDGKTVYLPLDNSTGYWTLSSLDMWKPRRKDLRALPGNSISIDYKHAFAMCTLDGYMYIRAKNGVLMRMDPKTSDTEVIESSLMAGSDSYLQFSLSNPNILYLAYTNKHCIYTYDIDTKQHTLYAGAPNRAGSLDGDRLDAEFNEPRQMLFDEDGTMYLADTKNHTIRKISANGIVGTVIGQPGISGYVDGNPDDALFDEPYGVTISKDGTIYIGDSKNHCVRKLAIE
jgi:hypothetical protein